MWSQGFLKVGAGSGPGQGGLLRVVWGLEDCAECVRLGLLSSMPVWAAHAELAHLGRETEHMSRQDQVSRSADDRLDMC